MYISIETNVQVWKKAIAQHALASPASVHLLDSEGRYATRAYHVEGFPSYLILDRQGRVWSGAAPRPPEGQPAAAALTLALAAK